MKTKKTNKIKKHDLRDVSAVRVAVPDVSAEFAGLTPQAELDEGIVSPSIGTQTPGQATHE